jgi:hypothetical protein
MLCPNCGGQTVTTHFLAGTYTRCHRPWAECNYEAAEAYPVDLTDDGADADDPEPLTAPDPDAWSTHDQLEWEEGQAA